MNQQAVRVPVGFRFHPMDEELVGYYLPKKVSDRKIDLDVIRDVDLYKLEPWDLQEFCKIKNDPNEKQTDYYFFSRKDKKYPTGNRSNRATLKGFWKATGRDKPIYTKLDQTLIGMRKTLVFYQGRAPHGIKTDWIMHEFRLDDGPDRPAHEDGGWVICRVFKKNKNQNMKMQHEGAISHEEHLGAPLPGSVPHSGVLARGGLLERSHLGVKQEIVNLDSTQPQFNPYLNQGGSGLSLKIEDSIQRARRIMKLDAANINRSSSNDNPNTALWQIRHSQTSSGSDATELNDDDTIDWSAWLQDPVYLGLGAEDSLWSPSTKKCASNDVSSPHLQIKRQNSDIFSSLFHWNDTPEFQQM